MTPSYNQAEYLEDAITSVLDQGYPNLEYMVMDGGSTDGSVEIIRRHTSRLAYWRTGADEGQADAIRQGFERSTGDILGWVNSDDMLLPGSLGKVANWFARHPSETWLVGGTIYVDRHGQAIPNHLGLPRCNLGVQATFGQLLFFGCPFSQPAAFWRREMFFAVGGFDTRMRFCFDYDLFLRLARLRRSGNIREFLALFREHAKSKSSTIRDVQNEENALLWTKFGRDRLSPLLRMLLYEYHRTKVRVSRGLLLASMMSGQTSLPTISSMGRKA